MSTSESLLTGLPFANSSPAPATRYPRDVLAMSAEELREEWLRQERALMEYDRLIDAVVDATFPPGEPHEGPPDWWDRHADAPVKEQSNAIVAGIVSLHELCGRQLEENDRLRARIAELESQVSAMPEQIEANRPAERCDVCGATLAHITGDGVEATLCPQCDREQLAEYGDDDEVSPC
ncbi:MAG TPA: hypothetical protein VED01_03370 [Burkholderiales bacterium]|nr:hypothetical protein [Burkholderiales bacterium]